MTRTRLELDVAIAAPAAVVWDLVTDWDAQGDWMLGTRVRSDGEPGVGQRLAAFTGVGRLGFWDTMEITEWDPPRRAVVLHTGRVVRGLGIFEVVPLSATGCRFCWAEELDLPGGEWGRRGWPLVRPMMAAGVAASLRAMRDLAEARAAAAPAA